MTATTLVQILILIDSLSAKVVEAIKTIGGSGDLDEAQLRDLITEYRDKNNARYEDVIAQLKATAEG